MNRSAVIIAILICVLACRERYGLPIEKAYYDALVVEGNILKGDTTVVHLSRATAVSEKSLVPQTGATVRVEGDDNSSYSLTESIPGEYKLPPFDVMNSVQYRLNISANGKNYVSDWTSLINTAAIDNVYWERNNGIKIFVKSAGTSEDSRYYKWDYEEVWEFNAKYQSRAYFTYVVDDAGKRVPQCIDKEENGKKFNVCIDQYGFEGAVYNDTMYTCWKYQHSHNINIGASTALSENVIIAPVRSIPEDSKETSILYSILVKQTGLSKDAYEFYQMLQGNTEKSGTIFDAQPSQLKTNIHCVSDPDELVFGYINTTAVKSKRLFISRTELPEWHYFDTTKCVTDIVETGVSSTLLTSGTSEEQVAMAINIGQLPVTIIEYTKDPFIITKYSTASKFCVDCRIEGEHKRPPYWP